MATNTARYRDADKRLWDSVGVQTTELRLDLATVGCTVRAQETQDRPPVVFIHRGATAGASWAMLVSWLPDFRCIVIDRPGMGLSELLQQGEQRSV